ncbi:hypothetical protein L1049_016557 [Liquidambar formosana]|uniref:Uncharacterized protein n=1 Tax=Liquidambar formosana TaxID=63359 RepID=A0AAP0S6I5_LIQFO
MVRLSASSSLDHAGSSRRLAIGFFVSVSSLLASCAKHASRVSRNLKTKARNSRITPKSPAKLLTSISNKAMFHQKKRVGGESEGGAAKGQFGGGGDDDDGGLWQRSILMGDKCQPLAFSGVIYYDSNGNQVSELPMRSPRASPLPSYVYSAAK